MIDISKNLNLKLWRANAMKLNYSLIVRVLQWFTITEIIQLTMITNSDSLN